MTVAPELVEHADLPSATLATQPPATAPQLTCIVSYRPQHPKPSASQTPQHHTTLLSQPQQRSQRRRGREEKLAIKPRQDHNSLDSATPNVGKQEPLNSTISADGGISHASSHLLSARSNQS